MPLKNIQDQVEAWVGQYKVGYWQPHAILARLAEEVGELAREINHLFGPKPKKSSENLQDLGEEMADIIFTLCCLANSQKVDLDQAFAKVMDKCYGRDKNRYEKK
jgi:NTP pyrophosphatase (non-canonical NTP hydrolase)